VSSTKYTLDRFEGDYAIFLKHPDETAQKLFHRTELPNEIKEGDRVLIEDEPNFQVTILKEETSHQKERVSSLLDRLRNKNN
jgi:hypothetical protein